MSYDTTPQKDRNKFIVAHLSGKKTIKEVQQVLLDAGYSKISSNRIWKIWKKSSDYWPRRAIERFCAFCLENKAQISTLSIVQDKKVIAKLCDDCWNRRPQQPIKQQDE